MSLAPNQIWDGTIEYFKAQGFTTVVLVAAEPLPYDNELQKIKQLGMYPILDIEYIIWNGGANKSTPITQFDSDFSMWKQAGWQNVATEGGRSGDLATLKDYFATITYFNCDLCGLWQDGHRSPDVTEMSWETYYPSEIPSIQQGALISYNLGKPQGITAGVWDKNNANLNYDTYKTLLDWSYSEGVGFTHFNVFFGLGATIADYQRLGFPAIISQLQQNYPPKPIGAWPAITVTSVRQVPNPQNSIVWDITNLGDKEAWVAPYAILHNGTAALQPSQWRSGFESRCRLQFLGCQFNRTTATAGYTSAPVRRLASCRRPQSLQTPQEQRTTSTCPTTIPPAGGFIVRLFIPPSGLSPYQQTSSGCLTTAIPT